jgi:molecular chaperone IbpA
MRYDFSPLYRSTIGFDRLFDLFEGQSEAESAPGWPPYNIEKVAEDAYRISVVAAGFTPDEIELVQKENELSVIGRKQPAEEGQYLHRGVANRAFKQTFNLAEHVKVLNANLENGMLTIALKREVPEALKPRRIEISSNGSPQTIPQGNKGKPEQIGRRDQAA